LDDGFLSIPLFMADYADPLIGLTLVYQVDKVFTAGGAGRLKPGMAECLLYLPVKLRAVGDNDKLAAAYLLQQILGKHNHSKRFAAALSMPNKPALSRTLYRPPRWA
jgi:hypothetical protein